MKTFLKYLSRLFLGEYSIYYIYRQNTGGESHKAATSSLSVVPIDQCALTSESNELILEQRSYFGEGSSAYGCFSGERLVGVCFYWYGSRYLQRNFWPLRKNEAKLVQIVTLPESRGNGVAPQLICKSFEDLKKRGFKTAYARVWHSNTPSCRAFEKSGWTKIALVIEINPLRRPRNTQLRFKLFV